MSTGWHRQSSRPRWSRASEASCSITLSSALIAAGLTFLTRSFIVALIVLIPMVLGLTIGLVQAIPALRYLPDLAGLRCSPDTPEWAFWNL